MDVTHIPEFGKQKFVHVTIDTFSSFLHASLQSREASKHCIAHCIKCFAVMGTPKTIKTDNGPGYTGKNFQLFCTQLSISHKTGIPIILKVKKSLNKHIKLSNINYKN